MISVYLQTVDIPWSDVHNISSIFITPDSTKVIICKVAIASFLFMERCLSDGDDIENILYHSRRQKYESSIQCIC